MALGVRETNDRDSLDLTEGRSTGVPKMLKAMAANGSPTPSFDTAIQGAGGHQ